MDAKFFHVCGIPLIPWDETRREVRPNEMEIPNRGAASGPAGSERGPKGYLYTSGQSDYYFIVWMSSNSNVATVDGDGKVTGRNAGTAIITAISDHGERAACKVTVTRKND